MPFRLLTEPRAVAQKFDEFVRPGRRDPVAPDAFDAHCQRDGGCAVNRGYVRAVMRRRTQLALWHETRPPAASRRGGTRPSHDERRAAEVDGFLLGHETNAGAERVLYVDLVCSAGGCGVALLREAARVARARGIGVLALRAANRELLRVYSRQRYGFRPAAVGGATLRALDAHSVAPSDVLPLPSRASTSERCLDKLRPHLAPLADDFATAARQLHDRQRALMDRLPLHAGVGWADLCEALRALSRDELLLLAPRADARASPASEIVCALLRVIERSGAGWWMSKCIRSRQNPVLQHKDGGRQPAAADNSAVRRCAGHCRATSTQR